MGSLIALIGSTIYEYITALPGVLSHMAMETVGEALVECGPWLVIVLIWRNPLIAMGSLIGMVLIFAIGLILAETISGQWSNRPRSLFSYESETRQSLD